MPRAIRLLTVAACLVVAGCSDASSNTSEPSRPQVKGTLLLDGAVNGCGGESVLVSVREGAEDVASAVASSATRGADCVYDFALPVPALPCYQLLIDKQPVGRYPSDPGGGSDVGIVLAESVYGDPATGDKPKLNADGEYC